MKEEEKRDKREELLKYTEYRWGILEGKTYLKMIELLYICQYRLN